MLFSISRHVFTKRALHNKDFVGLTTHETAHGKLWAYRALFGLGLQRLLEASEPEAAIIIVVKTLHRAQKTIKQLRHFDSLLQTFLTIQALRLWEKVYF